MDAAVFFFCRRGFWAWPPGQAPGVRARVGIAPPNATTYTDSGLTPGTIYICHVRAISGNVASDWSNEVTVVTPVGL